MSNFRRIDRDTGFLLPPSVDEWLPERHLARFVVEVVRGLDLRLMTGSYRGSGEASYHPELLIGLFIYGYATGVFSSRKPMAFEYRASPGTVRLAKIGHGWAIQFVARRESTGVRLRTLCKPSFVTKPAYSSGTTAARTARQDIIDWRPLEESI
jgi:hypothetical protein